MRDMMSALLGAGWRVLVALVCLALLFWFISVINGK